MRITLSKLFIFNSSPLTKDSLFHTVPLLSPHTHYSRFMNTCSFSFSVAEPTGRVVYQTLKLYQIVASIRSHSGIHLSLFTYLSSAMASHSHKSYLSFTIYLHVTLSLQTFASIKLDHSQTVGTPSRQTGYILVQNLYIHFHPSIFEQPGHNINNCVFYFHSLGFELLLLPQNTQTNLVIIQHPGTH